MWHPLIPQKSKEAKVALPEFFNSVAALMSLQLRSLVIESLRDLQQFFMIHEVWPSLFVAHFQNTGVTFNIAVLLDYLSWLCFSRRAMTLEKSLTS